jgi:hypothetical protein
MLTVTDFTGALDVSVSSKTFLRSAFSDLDMLEKLLTRALQNHIALLSLKVDELFTREMTQLTHRTS